MTWEGWTEKVHHGSVDWKRHPEDPYENCFSPSVLWCVSLLESSVLKKESYIYLHIYIYKLYTENTSKILYRCFMICIAHTI